MTTQLVICGKLFQSWLVQNQFQMFGYHVIRKVLKMFIVLFLILRFIQMTCKLCDGFKVFHVYLYYTYPLLLIHCGNVLFIQNRQVFFFLKISWGMYVKRHSSQEFSFVLFALSCGSSDWGDALQSYFLRLRYIDRFWCCDHTNISHSVISVFSFTFGLSKL